MALSRRLIINQSVVPSETRLPRIPCQERYPWLNPAPWSQLRKLALDRRSSVIHEPERGAVRKPPCQLPAKRDILGGIRALVAAT